ncbi:DUF4145 domain-containing protein [Perlucidibaca aquatica]|uniref:DUF4145 domain-containing protein n=1 Tax=Perlucidibaca aquatica TaxID=1852776 RepID=UPI00083B9037|nr:DUF4145 domain-containing protein [Perlucidibaca aquatica]
MQKEILQRIEELVARGRQVLSRAGDKYWVGDVIAAQAWMSSAANAIVQIAPPGSFYQEELARLVKLPDVNGIQTEVLRKVLGVLVSIEEEAKSGLLAKIEYQIYATAFDDFLDHASHFHRGGKVKESAILASSVLEDVVKRIARKHGIEVEGKTLEPLIDDLTKANVLTPVKAKRVKSFAGVRNHALHAEWDKLDLRDIGSAIDGVRELLEGYL